jgi:hypothetical protein
MREAFKARLQGWQDLYGLPFDLMLIVARHFKFREDDFFQWIEKQATLKYKIGIEIEPKIAKDPKVMVSLMSKNKQRLCLSCYD